MTKETKTSSLGEKIKKFRMPKFPPAIVVIFFVLLFVVLLTWIPHKGWVDTNNPFFKLDQVGLMGPKGIYLGKWLEDPIDWNNIANEDLTLILEPIGGLYLYKFLDSLNKFTPEQLKLIVSTSMGHHEVKIGGNEVTGIVISDIKIGFKNDWDQVAINYSGISFNYSILYGYDIDGNPESLLGTIELDKVYQTNLKTDPNGAPQEFGLSVYSGSIFELGGNNKPPESEEQFLFTFISGNQPNTWFNFWGSNYFVADDHGRYGILNIPFVILAGFLEASGVLLYLLCIGAFVEVMLQSGALEAGTSSLVKKMEGKELFLIPILFVMFCIGGTAFGMQEETLGLIPLIIPFLVIAGFDTMTGLLIVVMGTTSGIAASVLDPFSIGVMASSLTTPEIEVDISTGIVIRIIMFIAFATAGSAFCTWYGHRSKKGKDYVAEPEAFEKNQEWAHQMLGESHAQHTGINKRQAIGLIIFGATFGFMVFVLLPWLDWFEGLKDNPGWATFSSLFFAKLLFGEWYFVQLAFMFIFIAFILGWVFEMKPKETTGAMKNGMKGMIGVGMIITLSRSVAIVLSYSGLTIDMVALLFSGAGGSGEFSPVGLAWILYPIFALLAVFIPSTSGLAGITGPLISPMILHISPDESTFLVYATVVMVTYPLAQGTINMFSPTTGLVIAQAEVSHVNYGKALPILLAGAIGTMLIGMTIISISIPILQLVI